MVRKFAVVCCISFMLSGCKSTVDRINHSREKSEALVEDVEVVWVYDEGPGELFTSFTGTSSIVSSTSYFFTENSKYYTDETKLAALTKFINDYGETVKKDIARGDGESFDTFADILKIEDNFLPDFKQILQQKFSVIYEQPDSPAATTANWILNIYKDAQLHKDN